MRAFRLCLALLLAPVLSPAQDLKAFEKKVTEFTLPNGLHFIVAERHEAPVVSFHTYVNAGSVDDPTGQTGIAHMFEHMAFKGTETIGTKDWTAEKKALDAIEEIYDRIEAERNKGPKADPAKIDALQLSLAGALDAAESFVVPNEFGRIIEENGGAGLNADTSLDYTEYYYSLPSNRIELWFLLESQRFLHPVFREFYKERDVVMEEERMRIESNPQGKLVQQFLAASFEAHPYRVPGTGWPSDVMSLRRNDAKAFFEKYYVPANITIAIVGDVNPAEARSMAERYFGPLAAKPLPPLLHTVEPPQAGNRQVAVDSPSQPLALIGYKRPNQNDADDAVFDIMQLILSSGRTGLLYKDLVQEKRLAVQAVAVATFPDGRYPNDFVFFLVPAAGRTVDENQKALDDVLLKFESTAVDAETLNRAKAKARALVIRRLGDNAGLANLLTSYYANYGDWRKLFTAIDDLNRVTAADVQRVALKYLAGRPRTVAYIRTQIPLQSGPRRGGR
ncbi:Peptidase M16 domain protein [Candidatus Sulfopaludibacter sp. SbA3]|nr:Peptidase M16 domain protein [Candidatus Sulfopaludibacter sp. SbA3]